MSPNPRFWPTVAKTVLVLLVVAVALVVAGSVGVWWWLGGSETPSAAELEDRAADRPGVLDVVAFSPDGEQGPLQPTVHEVTVTMAADSTVDQVEDVLHAYDADLEDGHVRFLELGLRGTSASLTVGLERPTQDDAADAAALLDAVADPRVRSYVRVETAIDHSVEVEVEAADLASVVAYADRFGQGDRVESVRVSSGAFNLVRESQDVAAALGPRRERVAMGVEDRFGLDGASISPYSPVTLRVSDPAERRALRAYLTSLPAAAGIGPLRVKP